MTPDGKRIVTGGEDSTARIWDTVDGHELLTLHGHTRRVFSVSLTQNGQRLITREWDGRVKLWDVVSGRELFTLEGHNGAVACVGVTANGPRIVTGGGDGTAWVWDGATGRELLKLEGHSGFVWSVAVTPDGQRIVTGGDNSTARVWDAISGRELLTLKGHTGPVWSVAVTPDGRRIITGSDDGTVKIWEAASPEEVALWDKQEQETARQLAAWQRPVVGAPGFIQDWLVSAPIALKAGQRGVEAMELEQLRGEAGLQPRAGDHVLVGDQEVFWKEYHAAEPVLDFTPVVGKVRKPCLVYAVSYVISEMERNGIQLQVGSNDLAKVYLNGQEVHKVILPGSLAALDPVGPVRLCKGLGVTSIVSQCTFANNLAKGGGNAGDQVGNGGAIEDEPGVNVTVLNCSFTGNQADSGGGTAAEGGAIDDSPAVTVTISGSQFISNSAIGSGVGANAEGGAVDNFQTMTIASSLFTGNSAMAGPTADGIHTFGQALGRAIVTGFGMVNQVTVLLTLSNNILTGNEAIGGSGGSTLALPTADNAAGGGILNARGGTLSVAGCTITGNQAIGGASGQGSGGIAYGGGIDNAQGTLNLTDSTISTNLCQGGEGASGSAGGIAAGGGVLNARVDAIGIITNCTISFNESLGGAGGAGANGGAAVGGGIANAAYTLLFGAPDASSLTLNNCQIVGDSGSRVARLARPPRGATPWAEAFTPATARPCWKQCW